MLEVNNLSLLIATQIMSQEWPGSLVCGVFSHISYYPRSQNTQILHEKDAFSMCISTNCSWSFVYWVIILECIFVTSFILFYYVCTAVLHTLVAGLLTRS